MQADFPPPPPGNTGWPWIASVEPLPQAMHNGSAWPHIGVITPSYNQAPFLEETIRSVLLQGYPSLEYIVIDGGSTDGSLEIIRKYERWLAYWVSEPDRGQTHAINKGLAKATGQVVAWLNSDDTYLPGTLDRVAAAFQGDPPARLVYASAQFVDDDGQVLKPYPAFPLALGLLRLRYWLGWPIPQPTVFADRRLVDQYGLLDESYHYALDYEWLIRLSQYVNFTCLDETLATYRWHSRSKTGDWQANKHLFFAECRRANRKYAPWWSPRSWPLWMAQRRYDRDPAAQNGRP
jgi:glycosyltransferase involved in cell wall biosynthesis